MAVALGITVGTGCAGRGTVYMLPMTRSDFRPDEPLIVSIPVTEAYYWTDDDGTLCIALRYRTRSVLGEAFEGQWLLSIVLDGLPAGREKLYPHLGPREIRTIQSYRGDHRRALSTGGIVVIQAPINGRLKGRFHTWVRQQRFGVLTGWGPRIPRAPRLILMGEFEAVLDPGKGREILVETEADGFDRPALPPPTRPASTGPAPTRIPATAAGP